MKDVILNLVKYPNKIWPHHYSLQQLKVEMLIQLMLLKIIYPIIWKIIQPIKKIKST